MIALIDELFEVVAGMKQKPTQGAWAMNRQHPSPKNRYPSVSVAPTRTCDGLCPMTMIHLLRVDGAFQQAAIVARHAGINSSRKKSKYSSAIAELWGMTRQRGHVRRGEFIGRGSS